jgi:hypothetical protein
VEPANAEKLAADRCRPMVLGDPNRQRRPLFFVAARPELSTTATPDSTGRLNGTAALLHPDIHARFVIATVDHLPHVASPDPRPLCSSNVVSL